MPYSAVAFLSVFIMQLVHIFAGKTALLDRAKHGRLLSACGGTAIAYVFIDLLPKLAKGAELVQTTFSGIIPYIEEHVYVMALLGFLLFFTVDKCRSSLPKKSSFYLSMCSYALFNFLVGYAVVDKDNPEVQPLILFTFAMALHLFVNGYNLSLSYGQLYNRPGKWILMTSLFLGWLLGIYISLPEAPVALVSAFIGGGIIMNVIRHELPGDSPHSLGAFLTSSLLYAALLLAVG
ncbi:MAG: hypothetical protein JSR46_05120 [Verrucomicrobia bacterium]|nr:hypothetical protein [Verrucomicrobiota bacterium]